MIANPALSAVELFKTYGFVRIESLTTAADIAQIRALLDPLFEKFESFGNHAVDLAGPALPGARPRSPEINEAIQFAPGLRKTQVFARCRDLARRILGVPVGYVFDHAIYKPPHNNAATAWHQDEGYNTAPIPLRAVHFWIPLQSVNIENGCMWFVPESHRGGLLPYHVAHVRSGGAKAHTKGATIAADNVDASRAVACPLALGGVTAHHPLTLHYTGPNQSDAYRRAWILHFGAYGRFRFRLHPKCVAARLRALVTTNANER
jgi:phytanoyl-CoA dioxygenase PhyH